MRGKIFVTGTGTNVGKTVISCALSYACVAKKLRVVCLKPIETGCDPSAHDALQLARACGRQELADAADFYRARPALSPYAIELEGTVPALALDSLTRRVHALSHDADVTIVEGAGGFLTPLTASATNADFARLLGFSLMIVAPNQLGTLSQTLSVIESAQARALRIAGIVLNEPTQRDKSAQSNARVLRNFAPQIPIVSFARTELSPNALSDAALASELLSLVTNATI